MGSSGHRPYSFLFFAVPGIALLIGLGVWQLERREEKHALFARIEAGMAAAPAALPAEIADPAAWDYRSVTVMGRFRNDLELHLIGRSYRGQVGARILTPLVRDAGPPVLVDRGWVPEDRIDPATRPGGAPDGVVTVRGIARVPPPPGWIKPVNQPKQNLWVWRDLEAMAAATHLDPLAPVIVEALAGATVAGAPFPVSASTDVEIPDNHLQYAITWFALAAVLAVMTVVVLRTRGRDEE